MGSSTARVNLLIKYGLISGAEALLRFDPQDPPSPTELAALVFRFWRTHEGEAHIVIARSDAVEADQLSQMLKSAETIDDENGGSFECRVLEALGQMCCRGNCRPFRRRRQAGCGNALFPALCLLLPEPEALDLPGRSFRQFGDEGD